MRLIALLSVSGVLLALIGCGPPASIAQGEFAAEMAAVSCDRLKECARGDFESAYFGMEDCRATVERSLSSLVKDLDDADCDYNANAAGDLWVLVHDMSCEKFYEAEYVDEQNDVWGDCFGTE